MSIPAPLDKLPLLLVEGQLLPLLDESVQTLAPATAPSVVTAQSVADRLDVLAALAPGQTATLTLADGTVLTAARTATSADPLAAATDLKTCDRCALAEPTRLRVNAKSDAAFGGVAFTTSQPMTRLLRWDITLLP